MNKHEQKKAMISTLGGFTFKHDVFSDANKKMVCVVEPFYIDHHGDEDSQISYHIIKDNELHMIFATLTEAIDEYLSL